jgi:hypothetical protein
MSDVSPEVRIAVLETKMEQVQKELGEVHTALTSIDDKLAAIATRNPVNEFLKDNWKLVLLLLCIMLGGNAMKVVDVLLPAVTAQYTGIQAAPINTTTLPAKE